MSDELEDLEGEAHVEEMSEAEFEELVGQALDAVPDELAALVTNCVVLVEAEAPSDQPGLLGLYEGVPLTERGANDGGFLPDRIIIFRGPLVRMCETREQIVDEVYITVVHEIAHYFGIDDRRLHQLGYA